MFQLFEAKVKGLVKDDFAVGPIGVDDGGSSFLECDQDDTHSPEEESPQPPAPPENAELLQQSTSIQQHVKKEECEETIARPSNVYVLNVAFFSFLGFMAVQAVFAILANSQSMLADSEAMSVDALTYLFNMCAERIKNRPFTEHELSLPTPVRLRRRTLKRLYLELVPPLISVTTLIVVTFFVLSDSLETLFGPGKLDNQGEDVNITVMLLFSAINLALDVVNVTCFARAHQAFGLETMGLQRSECKLPHSHDRVKMAAIGAEVEFQESFISEASPLVQVSLDQAADALEKESPYGPNLNMCSAWTHVCADTMRSIAVLLASGLATMFPAINNEVADATAAVVVSLIIISSLLPLLYGLFLTAKEIVLLSRIPIS